MLLLNGKKMSKSDGNNITPSELFGDANNIFGRTYSPMVFKLLLLQAHYSSTLDLTKKGLDAAEAAYVRLMRTYQKLMQTVYNLESATDNAIETQFAHLLEELDTHMCNNFDTASTLSALFALATEINSDKHLQLSAEFLFYLKEKFTAYLFDIFGLIDETQKDPILDAVMHLVIEIRQKAREHKDFATSDLIRDRLKPVGIQIKDNKTGATWEKI
jgi:cysteinyl-tRNA synthetase